MAQNGGTVRYGIDFSTNTAELEKAKRSLLELKQLTAGQYMNINPKVDIHNAKAELGKIKESISALEGAYTRAFNSEIGAVNIRQFNTELAKTDRTLDEIYADMSKLGTQGTSAFRDMVAGALNANSQFKQTETIITRMGDSLIKTGKWFLSSSVINRLAGSVNQSVGYVKSLDSSLNDIRIVTGASADEMDRFAVKAQKAAKQLGAATTDYTNAALIYRQQGLGEEETDVRAKTTLKVANVTGQDAAAVSEELTALWNGYQIATEDTEAAVDKLSAVAAMSASSLEELATGMSKVASAAASMGVTEDQLVATMSTIISVTRQAPESVGTALKTIYARMGDLKFGKSDEDGVELGQVSGQLDKLGISILDQEGNMRDMGTVIEETAAKWQTWTDAQREAAAVAIAGKRQYNNLISLFDNWDKYTAALETSTDSLGTLQKQQDIYTESTEAHLQKMRTSFEGVYDSLLDADAIKIFADGMSGLATITEGFIDSIGGGIGTFNLLYGIITKLFSSQITDEIMKMTNNFGIMSENVNTWSDRLDFSKSISNIQNLDEGTQRIVGFYNVIEAKGIKLNEQQQQELRILSEKAAAYEREKAAKEEELETARLSLESQKEEQNVLKEKIKLLSGVNVDFKKFAGQTATVDGNNAASRAASNFYQEINSKYLPEQYDILKNKKAQNSQKTSLLDFQVRKSQTEDRGSDNAIKRAESLRNVLLQINEERAKFGGKPIIDENTINVNFKELDFNKFKEIVGIMQNLGTSFVEDQEKIRPFIQQLEDLKTKIKDLETARNTPSGQGTDFDAQKRMASFDNTKQVLGDFLNVGKEGIDPVVYEAAKEAIKETTAALDELKAEVGNGPWGEEQLEKLNSICAELEMHAGDVAEQFNVTQEAIVDGFNKNNGIEETDEQVRQLESDVEQLNNGLSSVNDRFNNFLHSLDVSQLINGVVGLTQGFSSLAMSATSFMSIFKTLGDETLTPLEKTLRIVTSLGMALPMLVSGLNGMANSWKSITAAITLANAASVGTLVLTTDTMTQEEKELIVKLGLAKSTEELTKKKYALNAANIQEAISSEKISEAEGKEALIKLANSKKGSLLDGMATKAANSKLFGKASTKMAEKAAAKGLGEVAVGAGTVGTAAAEGGAAVTGLGASIAALAPPILAVVAVLGVLGVGIYACVKAANKYKDAAKEAKEAAEQQAQAYEEIKNKYDNLNSALESYNSAKENIKDLTEGTKEWRDAVADLNEQVLDLLETYPELAKYVNYKDGQVVLNEEGVEEYQKILEEQRDKANESKILAQNQARYADNELLISNYNKTFSYETPNSSETTVTAGVTQDTMRSIINTIAKEGTGLLVNKTQLQEKLQEEGIVATDSMVKALTDDAEAIRQLIDAINKNNVVNDATVTEAIDTAIKGTANESKYNNLKDNEKQAFSKAFNDTLYSDDYQKQLKEKKKSYTAPPLHNGRNIDSKVVEEYANANGYKYNRKDNQIEKQDENGDWVTVTKDELGNDTIKEWKATQDIISEILTTGFEDIIKAMQGEIVDPEADEKKTLKDRFGTKPTYDKGHLVSSGNREVSAWIDELSEEDRKILLDVEIPEESKNWTRQEAQDFLNDIKQKNKLNIEVDSEEFEKDLDDVTKALEKMDKPYQNFLKNGKVLAKDIQTLRKTFKDMNQDTFAKYEAILTDSASTTEDLANAFDGLANSWIKETKLLDNLSLATADQTKEELEHFGIVNSLQVVTAGLCSQFDLATGAMYNYQNAVIDAGNATYTAAEAQEIFNTAQGINEETSQDVIRSTYNKLNAMYKEAEAAGQDTSAYQALMLNIIQANNTAYSGDLSGFALEAEAVKELASLYRSLAAAKDLEDGIAKDERLKGLQAAADRIISNSNRRAKTPNADYAGGVTANPSGSGGSSSKGNNLDKIKKEIDIYHEINTQIELLNTNLSKLEKQQKKLTGVALANNLKKQIEANQKIIEQEKAKKKLQETQLNIDKKAIQDKVKSIVGKKDFVTFNDDGTIANYDNVLGTLEDQINKKISSYNKKYGNKKKLNSKAKAEKSKIDKLKKKYDEIAKMMDENDSLANAVIETENRIQDIYDKNIATKIEAFDNALTLRLDTTEAERNLNDFIAEVTSKSLTVNIEGKVKGIQIGNDVLANAQALMKNAKTYETDRTNIDASAKTAYEDLISAADGNVFVDNKAEALEKLKDYIDKDIDAYKNLYNTTEEFKQSYVDLADSFTEEYSKMQEAVEFLNNSLDTQLSFIELIQGENAYDSKNTVYEAQLTNNLRQIQLAKNEYSNLKALAEMTERTLGKNSEEYKEIITKQREAYQKIAETTEAALKTVAEKYKNALDKIVKTTRDSLLSTIKDGSYGFWKAQYDTYDYEENTFLDRPNAAYQISTYTQDFEDAYDDMTNPALRKELQKLYDAEKKRLDEMKEAGKLSKEEVDFAKQRLEIKLKEIALEEAQNNKTKMRLRRDSQGNYSYVYTQDEDQVKKIEKELRQSSNNYYNSVKSYYTGTGKKIMDDLFGSDMEKIAELMQNKDLYNAIDGWSDEGKKQRDEIINNILKKATDSAEILQNIQPSLIDSVVKNMTYSGELSLEDYKKMNDEEKRKYAETYLAEHQGDDTWGKILKDIIDGKIDLNGIINDGVTQMQNEFNKNQEENKEVQRQTSIDINDTTTAVNALQEGLDNMTPSMKAAEDGTIAFDKAMQSLKENCNDSTAALEGYYEQMKNIINFVDSDAFVQGVNKISEWESAAAKYDEETAQEESNVATTPITTTEVSKTQQDNNKIEYDDYPIIIKDTQFYKTSDLKTKKGKKQTGEVQGKVIGIKWNKDKTDATAVNIESYGWVKRNRLKAGSFDTGGYTGDWKDNSGRLALLHSKELVLNRTDTKNILAAVEAVRAFESVNKDMLLRIANANAMNTLRTKMNETNQELKQNVHIDATFPGVKDAKEIENALNNLVNVASQYAWR